MRNLHHVTICHISVVIQFSLSPLSMGRNRGPEGEEMHCCFFKKKREYTSHFISPAWFKNHVSPKKEIFQETEKTFLKFKFIF